MDDTRHGHGAMRPRLLRTTLALLLGAALSLPAAAQTAAAPAAKPAAKKAAAKPAPFKPVLEPRAVELLQAMSAKLAAAKSRVVNKEILIGCFLLQ